MCLDFNLPKKISQKRIEKIKNPQKRLSYLFSFYSQTPIFIENKKNLGGLFDIIHGLEYHHKRHCIFEKNALVGKPYGNATHEATAYLNILGQIYYLFESEWFTKYVKKEVISSKIPTIYALIPIRNKYSAHRQQDAPYKDDCPSLGFNCFGLMPGIMGKINRLSSEKIISNNLPKIITRKNLYKIITSEEDHLVYNFPTKQRLPKEYPRLPVKDVEHIGEANNIIQFIPTQVHPIIINEILDLIRVFLEGENLTK